MNRRSFMLSTAVAAATASAAPRRLKAAVIGHTGHGNYGHGIDTVWRAFEHIDVVAVSDPDRAGREQARERLGAPKSYADYRQMLDREKPDFVSVCPRWMDQRVPMITAAAEAGCHIYSEKPFAATLEEADQIVEAIRRNRVKLQRLRKLVYRGAGEYTVRSGKNEARVI
jgi:predicted dehydrogenase